MSKFTGKSKLFEDLEPKATTHADTHTHEHKDTDNDVYVAKETKTKRIQILTYSKIVRRMDSYAKRHGMSRAEVFEKAVAEFLERNS
jgi:hypothetical protein